MADTAENRQVKVLCIGDPHFKKSNEPETIQMIDKVVDVICDHKPDLVVCLGDVLDRHETIHVNPLTNAVRMMESILEVHDNLVLIVGNHDRPNNSDFLSTYHPFTAMKEWEGMTVVDDVKEKTVKGMDFLFVPYVPNGRFLEAIGTQYDVNELDTWDAIFAHQEFFGCKMGAIISQDGDRWPLDYPLVISGHIHDYQRPQDNILYTGTPLQHGFGDLNMKTISMVTFTKAGNGTTLEGVNWEEERIDLGLPKRKQCNITVYDLDTFVPPENFILKVVVVGTTPEIKAAMKHHRIKEFKDAGYKVVFKARGDDDAREETSDAVDRGNGIRNEIEMKVQMSYLQALELAIKDDDVSHELFIQMFGGSTLS
jgi:DNA repair exonuclease SbcCD nuclease subunit